MLAGLGGLGFREQAVEFRAVRDGGAMRCDVIRCNEMRDTRYEIESRSCLLTRCSACRGIQCNGSRIGSSTAACRDTKMTFLGIESVYPDATAHYKLPRRNTTDYGRPSITAIALRHSGKTNGRFSGAHSGNSRLISFINSQNNTS